MSCVNRIPLFAILCLVLLHEVEVCRATLPQPLPVPNAHQVIQKGVEAINKGAEAIKKALTLPQPPHVPVQGPQINCKDQCFSRCSLASRYRMCFRTCNTCCQRCNCVPSCTSGNTQACPCWESMTHRGRKRCP